MTSAFGGKGAGNTKTDISYQKKVYLYEKFQTKGGGCLETLKKKQTLTKGKYEILLEEITSRTSEMLKIFQHSIKLQKSF